MIVIQKLLLAKEEYCMRIVSTLYNFGLNDNLNVLNINLEILNNSTVQIRLLSFAQPRKNAVMAKKTIHKMIWPLMILFTKLMICTQLQSTAHHTLFWGQFHTSTWKIPYIILPLDYIYVSRYIKSSVHYIYNSVNWNKTQNLLYISLCHLSMIYKKNKL